ncbi:MAG: GFA family protein [Lysobacteraceae bacterium]
MTEAAVALRGSCHCGRLAVSLSTPQAPAMLQPRACDCAFCTQHGPAWRSDPAGTLAIDASGAPRDYRQGSGSARFLLCGDCGVLVAVVHAGDAGLRGAVNVRCLDDAPAFGAATIVSPRQLPREAKIARWRQAWTPATLTLRAP